MEEDITRTPEVKLWKGVVDKAINDSVWRKATDKFREREFVKIKSYLIEESRQEAIKHKDPKEIAKVWDRYRDKLYAQKKNFMKEFFTIKEADRVSCYEITHGHFRLREAVNYLLTDNKLFTGVANLTTFTGHNLGLIRRFITLPVEEYVTRKKDIDIDFKKLEGK